MLTAPAIFLAHGSPMMAIWDKKDDPYIKTLSELWEKIAKPEAILLISAHWTTTWLKADNSEMPEQIFDFYWFSDALYKVKYTPNWDIKLANEISEVIWKEVKLVNRWLDHGWWTVLKHLYPDADIPIVSLSIDENLSLKEQYELWMKLRVLRKKNIMILWSWNIVHNLQYADFWYPKTWAYKETIAFDNAFTEKLLNSEIETLLNPSLMPFWNFALPTVEHYIPAIIILWASFEEEHPEIIFSWYELWSISRLSFMFS